MDAYQWEECLDQATMLYHVQNDYTKHGDTGFAVVSRAPLPSPRKLRLLMCSLFRLCQQYGHRFDPENVQLIDRVEGDPDWEPDESLRGGWRFSMRGDSNQLLGHLDSILRIPMLRGTAYDAERNAPKRLQADLFREALGNPFVPVARWKTCPDCYGDGTIGDPYDRGMRSGCGACDNTGKQPAEWIRPYLTADVLALAHAAYDERPGRWVEGDAGASGLTGRPIEVSINTADGKLDPVRLNVLADCLEEMDFPETHMLQHLRSPGPHYRGCWVLDILIGRD